MLTMETLLLALNLMGTVAFAISGAMTGIRKRMDILGVLILGMVTAVGGGMTRDLILGIHPPMAFRNPLYALTALGVSALVFVVLYFHMKGYERISGPRFQYLLGLADAVGLGLFTVVGVQTAVDAGWGQNLFVAVFLGTITGVGGGLLRDIMASDQPFIFVKHIYACASIGGALLCALLWNPAGQQAAMLTGAAAVVLVRVLAAHYRWNLPRVDWQS